MEWYSREQCRGGGAVVVVVVFQDRIRHGSLKTRQQSNMVRGRRRWWKANIEGLILIPMQLKRGHAPNRRFKWARRKYRGGLNAIGAMVYILLLEHITSLSSSPLPPSPLDGASLSKSNGCVEVRHSADMATKNLPDPDAGWGLLGWAKWNTLFFGAPFLSSGSVTIKSSNPSPSVPMLGCAGTHARSGRPCARSLQK
ncbi:hypothetical protein IWX90DRAFT_86874 [Phyllosticta citrichinensis]|uniref:Uncharacterized protein n=1 Tax=Phyllosticta citrichinensis TaxID=1130410 RepID=A0ABR1XFF2_9PEZI